MAGRGGIDVDALSPRDINALPKRTTDLKAKATAQLKSSKDKDHPPPPPPQIAEPPSSDRSDGAVYQVGKILGKGGFAICYDGKHVETGKRYALKIVKSQMPLKMQQKVSDAFNSVWTMSMDTKGNTVPNRTADPFEDATSEHCPISPCICL